MWLFSIVVPYLIRDEVAALAQETGLTETQIANWFSNARRRNRSILNIRPEIVAHLHGGWRTRRDRSSEADIAALQRATPLESDTILKWVALRVRCTARVLRLWPPSAAYRDRSDCQSTNVRSHSRRRQSCCGAGRCCCRCCWGQALAVRRLMRTRRANRTAPHMHSRSAYSSNSTYIISISCKCNNSNNRCRCNNSIICRARLACTPVAMLHCSRLGRMIAPISKHKQRVTPPQQAPQPQARRRHRRQFICRLTIIAGRR